MSTANGSRERLLALLAELGETKRQLEEALDQLARLRCQAENHKARQVIVSGGRLFVPGTPTCPRSQDVKAVSSKGATFSLHLLGGDTVTVDASDDHEAIVMARAITEELAQRAGAIPVHSGCFRSRGSMASPVGCTGPAALR